MDSHVNSVKSTKYFCSALSLLAKFGMAVKFSFLSCYITQSTVIMVADLPPKLRI